MAFNGLNDTPGPGKYKPETYQRKNPVRYSMAHKYDDPGLNKNPGPG